MRTSKKSSLVLLSVVATMALGLVGMPAAHADASVTVSPSTALSDPNNVAISVSNFVGDAYASLQVAECGNAYANLTPLPSKPAVTPGIFDAKDCMYIGFLPQGTMTQSSPPAPPVMVGGLHGPLPTVQQTGIGTGNRSCILAPPAAASCFVYVSTSVNLALADTTTEISFANATPTSHDPAATTTTITPVGSPVALGKDGHALVHVTTADPLSEPDGTVEVYDGETLLGSAVLDDHASASVDLGVLTGDLTDLTAQYIGNGSFAGSMSSAPAALSVTTPDNISVGDASIVEGDSHVVRNMVFPVVLSNPVTGTTSVSVNYSLVPTGTHPATIGSATMASTDVVALSTTGVKTLIFKPGPTTVKYITVHTLGNTDALGDTTFALQLQNTPTMGDYTIRRGTGNGLIIDDDNPTSTTPTLGVGDASVPEGDFGGAHALKFPVTLSSPSTTTLTVVMQVASGTAVQGTKLTREWSGSTSRKLVFKPGQVTKLISVPTYPNLSSGLDKTVLVTILSATPLDPNAGVSFDSNHVAVGTILSDE